MTKLRARRVQELLKVNARQVLSYGYQPLIESNDPRLTLIVFFFDGKLVRLEYYPVLDGFNLVDAKPLVRKESEWFEPSYFFDNVKRWYADNFNENLLMYFETFGSPTPPLTPGASVRDLVEEVFSLLRIEERHAAAVTVEDRREDS